MNQIRAWVRQGRTDAWISHQLDISIDQLERFKREHDLTEAEPSAGPAVDPLSIPVPEPGSFEFSDDEEDEDELEEGNAERQSGPTRSSSRGDRGGRGRGSRGGRGRGRSGGGDRTEESQDERRKEGRPSRGRERAGRAEREARGASRSGGRDKRDDRDPGDDDKKRRRGRRGGRRRSKIPNYEATFEHGGEGYGFWIDPSIVDNPVYGEHWAGHRAIVVRIDPDSITIKRADLEKKPDSASD